LQDREFKERDPVLGRFLTTPLIPHSQEGNASAPALILIFNLVSFLRALRVLRGSKTCANSVGFTK